MKRGIAAAVIILCVCSAAFAISSFMEKKTDELIDTAYDLIENSISITLLEEKWDKESTMFSFFVGHDRLEPVSALIEELKYLSDEDKHENCSKIIAQFKELREHISLSLYNVF